MRVGFFGGSFNPPHVAHVLACTYALSAGGFDRIVVAPVFRHAFSKSLVDFDHRVAMAERAMGWIPGVEVSRIERELADSSYTLHTLERLQAEHPDWQLRLIIGADVLGETDKWHAFDRVMRIAPVFPLGRVGVAHADAPPPVLPEISSTDLRQRLMDAPDRADVARHVPSAVLDYIADHGLYR